MRKGNINNEYYNSEYTSNKNRKTKKEDIKKSHIISMVIWLLIFIFMAYQLYLLAMYTIGKVDKEKVWLYNTINNIIGFSSNKTNLEESTLKLAALGDIYLTTDTINASKTSSGYNFLSGTEKVKDELKKFDLVFASLATPVTNNTSKNFVSTKKAGYKAPAQLIDNLKDLNISVLATATNHAFDNGSDGISETINILNDKNIKQIGINESESKILDPIVIEQNNIKLGILSYTVKSEEKLSDKDSYLINILDEDTVKKDVKYLNEKNVDFIISYLCIPNEDSNLVSNIQKESVELLVNNGVNVVFGTGSNIPQEYFEDQVEINNKNNHVYAVYSLGDFFGSYETYLNRTSVIANIEFTKKEVKNKKGEVISSSVSMNTKNPIFLWTQLSSKNLKTIYIISNDLVNSNSANLPSQDYNNLKKAYERLTSLYEM